MLRPAIILTAITTAAIAVAGCAPPSPYGYAPAPNIRTNESQMDLMSRMSGMALQQRALTAPTPTQPNPCSIELGCNGLTLGWQRHQTPSWPASPW